ncbi:MAG: CHAT domain-containing protein [Candidatus Acidiferrales bacterium]
MGTSAKKSPVSAAVLRKLGALADDSSRDRYLKSRPGLLRKVVALYLNDVVRSQLRADTRQALSLAEAAVTIARRVRSREAMALSLRSKANALYMLGQNKRALDFHAEALSIFRQIGDAREQARTLIPTIQPLILLGEYQSALEAAAEAKQILDRIGDSQRLGHLEINVGNIYHRQDRFEEALACYERAYESLLPFRDSEGLAVALYNIAVCLISLNDFPRALASYQRARKMCVQHGMTLLVIQADYNIAYLYYLRGEYGRAIEMLRATREKSEQNGDAHILALCYLDLSDIYLELNLSSEAREVAHEGWERFRKLGMGYEEAKCQANEAVALSQLGKAIHALQLFDSARAKFVHEKNLVWPWLIDLYRALVLYNEGRYFESRRFCEQAAEFFDQSFLPNKAVLCHVLLARLSFRTGDAATAEAECSRAMERLSALDAPALRFQAEFLAGQIAEASGALPIAYQFFQRAREALETLRSSLHGEELKIAFMKNRLEVYECLVDICMNNSGRKTDGEEAFGYMEMAKSRSLAELLVHHAQQPLPDAPGGQSNLVRKIREMREELNWYYRRLEIEQLQTGTPSPERIEQLRQKALAQENDLLRALHELPQSHNAGPHVAPESVDRVRDSLPKSAAMIEYFSVKGHFVAAILTHRSLEIFPLTPVSRVVNLLRMLEFQISKFRLGGEYTRQFAKPLLESAQAHLRNLYVEILAPIRSGLSGDHLIIVPHGVLHYLPFHALLQGDRYLIDDFSISYAPSATTFALCQRNPGRSDGPPLVMGVPDARAPFILEEVQAVSKSLPGATLLVGAEANESNLQQKGLGSRAIHIATHGTFRQDNPMFSNIRLGETNLGLYDLYQLKLDCELMTLSGCATGLNVVTAGDELLGLVRGLLFAGARSLLLSLWDVHDRTTAEFMTAFYQRLSFSQSKAAALQSTMLAMRERYPHPYFWAPFTLIGKISAH